MSDIPPKENIDTATLNFRQSVGLGTASPPAVELERIPIYESPADEFRDSLGLETSPMYQKRKEIPPTESLFSSLAALDDPISAITQINAAQYLSEVFKLDPLETLNNLDEISEYWLGKVVPPKTLMESVVNAWENGMRDYDISKLYTQLRFSDGGINPEIEKQIADITAQMVPLAEMPLPWVKQTLLTVAGSGPLMLKSLTEGVKLAVPGAIPALLVPGLAPIIFGMGMVVGSVTEMMDAMAGRSYGELRAKNVPHEIAAPISDIAGIIQGAVEFTGEAIVGFIPGISGIGGTIANRMLLTGTTAKIATRIAAGMITLPFGEGIEEGLQTFTDIVAEQVARELSEKSTIEPTTIEEIAKRIGKDAMMGLSAGLIFAIPGMPFGIVATTSQLQTIKTNAAETTKDVFVNTFAKDEIAKKASPEAWKTYLGKVWDKQHGVPVAVTGEVVQVQQPNIENVDQLYEAAAAEQPKVQETITEIAAETDGEVTLRPALKDRTRAETKIAVRYKGDVSRLKDVNAGMITYETEEQVLDAAKVLEQRDDVVFVEERLTAETPMGYRDISVNMKTDTGHIYEVQLNTRAVMEAREASGHAFYKVFREADAAVKLDPEIAPEDRTAIAKQLNKLVKISREYYTTAREGGLPAAVAFASSSETMTELKSILVNISESKISDSSPVSESINNLQESLSNLKAWPSETRKETGGIPPPPVSIIPEEEAGSKGPPPPPPDVDLGDIAEEARKKPEGPVKRDLLSLGRAWKSLRDMWLGAKALRSFGAEAERRRLRKELLGVLGKKRYTAEVKAAASAIHIYNDTKRNPAHIALYYDKLSPTQKKLLDMSQNLSPELIEIADKIQASDTEIGLEAYDADVIHNTIENHANRIWDLKGKEFSEVYRKFGIKSRHSRHRVFETIIEGWAAGYELRTADAIDNLAVMKEELGKTIEDKRFLKAMMKITDADGNHLLSTHPASGYKRVEHPNFKYWQYAGSVEIEAIRTQLSQVYSEVIREEGVAREPTAAPIEKLESVMQFALESKGFTTNEALVAIERIKKAKTKSDANTIIRNITKTILVRQEIRGYDIVPVVRKNLVIGAEGTILERSELYAPQDVANDINNILGISQLPKNAFFKFVTKYNALIKGWILLTSFFHHQAFIRSYYLPSGRKRTLGEMNFTKAYKLGTQAIEREDPILRSLVKNGLTFGRTQDYDLRWQQERGIIGTWLDKAGAVKAVRDKVISLRQRQTEWLFGEFGAGLKAQAALIEFREQLKKYPGEDSDAIAKRVANLLNDDFGGLNLERMGRNPTMQHILRLFLLAPDWTESNVRTMAKALRPVSKIGQIPFKKIAEMRGKEYDPYTKQEARMYRQFWVRAAIKGLGTVALLNFILAGGDLDEMQEKYKKAWGEKGEWKKLRWAMADITPIYQALGGKKKDAKYFNVLGHFRDPFKFLLQPGLSLKHKGSVVTSAGLEALSGEDWAGRKFTTLDELLKEGKTVKWKFQAGPVEWAELPSFVLSQIIGAQPIFLQNFMAWVSGEQEGFDAIMKSMGIDVKTAREK